MNINTKSLKLQKVVYYKWIISVLTVLVLSATSLADITNVVVSDTTQISTTLDKLSTYHNWVHFQKNAISSDTIATSIAGGDYHTCALTANGAVKCWGNNYFGALGNGTNIDSNVPVAVSGLSSGVSAIAAGEHTACALTINGAVKCWGDNAYGLLGNGTDTDSNIPVGVSGLSSGISAIAMVDDHACALTTSGAVKCWGVQRQENGTGIVSYVPVSVNGLTNGVKAISSGWDHSCALTTNGAVKCWGANHYGQLGNGTNIGSNVPVDVSGLTEGVIAISSKGGQTCAVTANRGLKCWGANFFGQLGNGSTIQSNVPVDVNGLTSGVRSVSVGWYHTCALTTDGTVKCWGYAYLGNGVHTQSNVPVDVTSLINEVSVVSTGWYHTCVITTSGIVKCWGNNEKGQLGTGTNIDFSTIPVDVVGFNGRVPLILIPGIGGSKLTNSVLGEQWPRLDYVVCNDDSDAELRNLELDTTGTTDMWIQISVAGILLAETPKCHGVPIPFTGQHFYDGTIEAIQNAGYQYREDINNYQQGDNFFVFPYDWRKDVQVTADELLAFIDTVRQKTGVSQVDILAHSMGGLATRIVLANPNSTGKIRKVLTLGTPVLGAPKALGLLEYQSPCFVESCVYDPAIFQEVVTNFPGVYALLPSPNYDQAAVEMPLLISRDVDGDGFFEGEQDYSKWSSIVAEHRNSAILTQSKIFHETFDDFTLQDPLVQYVAFAGDGVDTPIQIRESMSTDSPSIIKYEIKWSKHGDGTVPLYSSSLYNLIKDYDIRNGVTVKIYSGVTHTGFPLDTTVLNDAISFFASPDNIFADSPPQDMVENPSINPGTEIEVSGSAKGYILDSSGNKSGQNDSLDGLVELNIPGSHYYAVADTHSYFFDNPDSYHAEYTATGDGIFIIRVSDYQNDDVKKVAVFGLNESPGAQAKIDYTSGQDVADIQVQIDSDGNGTIDETRSPDLILDGTTTTITADTPDPSRPNQSVHVDVTVTGGSTSPTGLVDVSGADTNCQITLVDGIGGCDVVFATSGSKTLIATYNGDDTHLDSSDSETHKVRILKTFKSVAAQDGWILESTETSGNGGSMNSSSTLLYLGDNAAKKQYRSILSFNTSSLPDNAVVTKVTLKFKKQGVAGGGDPVTTFQGFMADVKKGLFGTAPLALGDFKTAANKTVASTSPTLTSGWYSLNLTPAKNVINKLTTGGGLTQIRIRFKLDDNNNAIANYLKVYSGNAGATNRPQLIIEYYVP